jgi:hypothetical protein
VATLIAGLIGLLLVVFGALVFGVLLAMWRGFVIQNLWNWLIVPTFAFRTLNIAQAFALSFVVGVMVGAHKFSNKKASKADGIELFGHLLSGAMALLVGWIVKTYWL